MILSRLEVLLKLSVSNKRDLLFVLWNIITQLNKYSMVHILSAISFLNFTFLFVGKNVNKQEIVKWITTIVIRHFMFCKPSLSLRK